MELRHEIKEEVLIIHLEGEVLDASQSPTFKKEIIDLIDQNKKINVIFDLKNLRFIDSSGLGSFLSILRHTHKEGGDLKLACMKESVKKMFMIVRMHRLFEIFDSTEDAYLSFAQST